VVQEYAALLKSYRISKVTGDRYAGEWPREQFRKYGVQYEVADKSKSDIYRDLLPLLNSRRVELLDNQRLIGQLVSLERRTARGGRDSIDHPPRAHDDIANSVAGVLTLVAAPKFQSYCGPISCYSSDSRSWRQESARELSNAEKNSCIPGRGLDPDATLFNAERGIPSNPIIRRQ
jgi:hypothetical protein